MGQVIMKHVSKDHSKFSTPPLEFLWWRADITKEDVRWVRQHLGRGLDGAREFEVYPNTFVIGYGPIARDWRHRVHFSEGTTSPLVQIPLGEKYDYRNEYVRARREEIRI